MSPGDALLKTLMYWVSARMQLQSQFVAFSPYSVPLPFPSPLPPNPIHLLLSSIPYSLSFPTALILSSPFSPPCFEDAFIGLQLVHEPFVWVDTASLHSHTIYRLLQRHLVLFHHVCCNLCFVCGYKRQRKNESMDTCATELMPSSKNIHGWNLGAIWW